MIEEIKAYLRDVDDFEFEMSVSLPPGTGSGHRFYMPDMVVYSDGAISHIIEVEDKTNTTTLFGKMALANRALDIMTRDGVQPESMKPNLIILYDPDYKAVKRVIKRVEAVRLPTKYLDEVIVAMYPGDWEWFP
jgi:hypothetical protein